MAYLAHRDWVPEGCETRVQALAESVTGLEAVEEIEAIAAELAARVFNARLAEVRIFSGAITDLFWSMAITKPRDKIIVPPAGIGGHVTHHAPGAAGLYGLKIVEAPIDAERHTVDLDGLAQFARDVKPWQCASGLRRCSL